MTASSSHRTIEGHTLFSSDLNEERFVKVFLPLNYDDQQAYPILYCHDGNEFFTHGRIATIATRMMEEGQLAPFLIAGIAVSAKHRTEDYSLYGARNDQYVPFVGEQCIPFVESRYQIIKEERYMAGISLGAVVTLLLHERYPDLFSRLLLFSTAFKDGVLKWLLQAEFSSDTRSYMLIGTEENAAKTPHGIFDFLTTNRAALKILQQKGISVTYEEEPGSHIWGFWQEHLPKALVWLQNGP